MKSHQISAKCQLTPRSINETTYSICRNENENETRFQSLPSELLLSSHVFFSCIYFYTSYFISFFCLFLFCFFINRNEFPLLFFVVVVIKPQTGISIQSILVSSFICNLPKECTKKSVERQKYADYICERNFRVPPWFVSNKFRNANSWICKYQWKWSYNGRVLYASSGLIIMFQNVSGTCLIWPKKEEQRN